MSRPLSIRAVAWIRTTPLRPVLRLIVHSIRFFVAVLYFPLAVLLLIGRVRLIALTHPGRIGHLCIEPDCFIKEGILGLRPRFHGVFLVPRGRAANRKLLDLWKEQLTIVTSPVLCAAIGPLLRYAFVRYPVDHYAVAIESTAACGAIYAKWGDRPPLLKKESVDIQAGWQVLQALGLPAGSWFVCVHSRDGHYSPHDEHVHSYRNSSIENYRLAMEAIHERGGWCVRVGEPTPASLPPMRGVIDYANSDKKSDWMDVFLCAHCRFFLGNSSGLYLVSTAFGVKSALANLIPISGALPVGCDDLGIPKLLRSRQTGTPIGYGDILGTAIANFRFGWQYDEKNILVEENSAEDIKNLAIELLERLSGAGKYGEEDEKLQERFHSLIRPGHYSFGADSRIGRDFLREHAHLL